MERQDASLGVQELHEQRENLWLDGAVTTTGLDHMVPGARRFRVEKGWKERFPTAAQRNRPSSLLPVCRAAIDSSSSATELSCAGFPR